MAKRRPIETENDTDAATDDGTLIMPRRFVDYARMSPTERTDRMRERRRWLTERGIDPGDWRQFYPILLASNEAAGIATSLERARRRSQRNAT